MPATSRHRPTLGSDYKDAKRSRRRLEILDAAASVFAAKGYFAATMQDIADLLGMRPASLYYYVKSKEAALEEVCRHGGREFVDALQTALADDAPVADLIDSGVRLHLNSRWRDYVANFAFNRQHLAGAALSEMNRIARDYAGLWETLLKRGQKSGEISADLDPRLGAAAILAICNDAARAASSGGTGHEKVARNTVALLMNGLRAG